MANNYQTKFAEGQPVVVINGFYKGRKGKIDEYFPEFTTQGIMKDYISKGLELPPGFYLVKFEGWFGKTVYVEEKDLA